MSAAEIAANADNQTGNNTWIWILIILGAAVVIGGVVVYVKKREDRE